MDGIAQTGNGKSTSSAAPLEARVRRALEQVGHDRHKLIILLGPFGSGKTALLKAVAPTAGARYLNLNLALSERLLTVPRSQYDDGVTVHRLVDEICDELSHGEPLFVDNVELLFSPELGRINPVDTFKRIARQRPVVLALPGRRIGGQIEYSQVGRADYMAMPVSEQEYAVIETGEGKA